MSITTQPVCHQNPTKTDKCGPYWDRTNVSSVYETDAFTNLAKSPGAWMIR